MLAADVLCIFTYMRVIVKCYRNRNFVWKNEAKKKFSSFKTYSCKQLNVHVIDSTFQQVIVLNGMYDSFLHVYLGWVGGNYYCHIPSNCQIKLSNLNIIALYIIYLKKKSLHVPYLCCISICWSCTIFNIHVHIPEYKYSKYAVKIPVKIPVKSSISGEHNIFFLYYKERVLK